MNELFTGSRKFAYCALGLVIGSFFYLFNVYLVIIFPTSQASLISLFNTIISYIAGLISVLTGTHTFMDWKNTQVNETNLSEETETIINPNREPKDYDVPLDQL